MVLPPDQSSVGIWTYEVSRRLGADCETTVIARRPRGKAKWLEIDGVRIELLTCAPARVWGRASRMWSRAWPGAPLFAQSFYAFDFFAQALRRLRRLAPDVVHLQNFPHYAPAIRRAVPDAAILLHMHCDWLAQLDRDVMARGIAACDLVAGCSQHVVATARERFGSTRTPFAVLPNGAPVDRLARVTAQRTPAKVLFVGRVSPEKGVHTLLEAWPKVVAAHPEACLEIVGPPAALARDLLIDLSRDPEVLDLSRFYPGGSAFRGSYGTVLREMIPPQLGHTVTFTGMEPYEKVIERCAGASLLVNPSLSESFGMSLVEALATGTPVVATRVGGMTDIVEATGGGLLVEKNDPAALSDAIVRLLADPQSSNEIGRQGAQRVAELYSWEKIAQSTRDLYDKAIVIHRSRLGKRIHSFAQRRALNDVNTEPVSSPHSQLTASPTRKI
ncbi:glycosyltransferase family 4 protein [Mesorhizobium escarrei]|nr:glycosyltransferase family 4 protein [Mesorhizobium escarrei]